MFFFLFACLQITAGLLYGNLIEWIAHKYFLHNLGKNPKSILSFHWHEHHRKSRLNNFHDDDYEQPFWNWNSRGKEIAALVFLFLIHSWLFFFFPIFVLVLGYCVANYYLTHKWAHENPKWAKKHLSWHWAHHQMRFQDMNFCVTRPWFDLILCTRVYYRKIDNPNSKSKKQKFEAVRPKWYKGEL